MKDKQKLLLFVIAISFIIPTIQTAIAAEPILGEVTLNPEHPTKLSKITFDVNVVGDDIKTVKIYVLECNETTGICQNSYDNQTMQHIGGSLYRANITLDFAPASYITYKVYVENNIGDITPLPNKQGVKVYLSTGSSNGNNSTNNNGNGSPGFEVVLFIVAVCVTGAIILLGRKRFR